MSEKRICLSPACNWRGTSDQVLAANHPFMHGEKLYGCPKCKEIGQIFTACDEPGCWRRAYCGTPTPAGFRHTCGKHRPGAGTKDEDML